VAAVVLARRELGLLNVARLRRKIRAVFHSFCCSSHLTFCSWPPAISSQLPAFSENTLKTSHSEFLLLPSQALNGIPRCRNSARA
jgi:hypothetical protein